MRNIDKAWSSPAATAATVVNETAAAQNLGLAVSTIQKLRLRGGGPKFLKLGRAVRYRVADLESWLDARVLGSTSEQASR